MLLNFIFLVVYKFCTTAHFVLFVYFSGTLNGPDIRRLLHSSRFFRLLGHETDLQNAWLNMKHVILDVLGKNRVGDDKAKEYVNDMLKYFELIGASMSLKLHFLHCHLDDFLKQLPTESDEEGERFHQTIMPFESRFKGKKLNSLLAELCWWSQRLLLHEQSDDTDDGGNKYTLSSPYVIDDEVNDDEDGGDGEPLPKRPRGSTSMASTSLASTSMDTS